MWNTGSECRPLTEAEQLLFVLGIYHLHFWLDELTDDPSPTKHAQINQLPRHDRAGLIGLVAMKALDPDFKMASAAWSSSIGYAAIEEIKNLVESEDEIAQTAVEDGEPQTFLVLPLLRLLRNETIARQRDEEEEDLFEEPPAIGTGQAEYWQEVVSDLFDDLLEDTDFESFSGIQDRSPEEAEAMKEAFGIPRDYFLAQPPPLNQEAKEKIRLFLEDWGSRIEKHRIMVPNGI